ECLAYRPERGGHRPAFLKKFAASVVDQKLGLGLGEVHRRTKRKAGSEGEFRPGDIAIWGLLTKRVHSQEECSSSAVSGIRDKWLRSPGATNLTRRYFHIR